MLKWESWMGGCGETQGANNTIPVAQLFLSCIFISQLSYLSIRSIATITSSKEGSANSLACSEVFISRKVIVWSVLDVFVIVWSSGKGFDVDPVPPASKLTCCPTPETKTLSRQRVLGNRQVSSQSEKELGVRSQFERKKIRSRIPICENLKYLNLSFAHLLDTVLQQSLILWN